jgi:hypothetical protein
LSLHIWSFIFVEFLTALYLQVPPNGPLVDSLDSIEIHDWLLPLVCCTTVVTVTVTARGAYEAGSTARRAYRMETYYAYCLLLIREDEIQCKINPKKKHWLIGAK